MSKGIHDPWRLGTPEWKPPVEDQVAGTPSSEEDLDWDLKPDVWHVFRAPGGALKIMGTHHRDNAALRLLELFMKDQKFRKVLESAGFTDDGRQQGFVIKGPQGTLCCPDATNMLDGLRRMIGALRASIRADRALKAHFNQLGIIPLVE